MLTQNLDDILKERKNEFHKNNPFPHIIIDNLFDDDILRSATKSAQSNVGEVRVYGDKDQMNKRTMEGKYLLKGGGQNLTSIENNKIVFNKTRSTALGQVFNFLNGKEFVNFIGNLTDIDGLFSDDTFRGGGIHKTDAGGFLKIHIDFSRPKWDKKVFRRANVLLYLNEGWKEEWGGDLELWDNPVKKNGKCIKKVEPVFNRLVIFGTRKNSWHGHPHPLNTPSNISRWSFATYYYSKNQGDDSEDHNTLFH